MQSRSTFGQLFFGILQGGNDSRLDGGKRRNQRRGIRGGTDKEATTSVQAGAARVGKPGGEPRRYCYAAKVVGDVSGRGPRPAM
jgi:hypothetical protein